MQIIDQSVFRKKPRVCSIYMRGTLPSLPRLPAFRQCDAGGRQTVAAGYEGVMNSSRADFPSFEDGSLRPSRKMPRYLSQGTAGGGQNLVATVVRPPRPRRI